MRWGPRPACDLDALQLAERLRLIARWAAWGDDALKAELVRRWWAATPLVDTADAARAEEGEAQA